MLEVHAKSKIGINLAKAKILKVEQEIFYQAIEAYTGLVLKNKKLKINLDNINLLDRQVETDKARLERGQITISDLAQSESSLAGAQAKYIEAKNDVTTSLLIYNNVIGPINLGNPREFTIKQLAELVIKITGAKSKLIFEDLPEDDPLQRCPDIGLAKQKLDWQPSVDLEIGLERTINYFSHVI